jgi:flagellar motor switch protein FliN/FliY
MPFASVRGIMADDDSVPPPENPYAPRGGGPGAFALLKDVEVELTLEIGRRRMKIEEILRLSTGATIELSKAAGEPIDIYVNGQLLGRGEAVVVGDRYGVRITELLNPEGRS